MDSTSYCCSSLLCQGNINIILARAFVCLVCLSGDLFGAGNVYYFLFIQQIRLGSSLWFGARWSYGVISCPLLIVCCFMILLHKAFHRMYSWTVFCLERLWARESHPHISQVHQQDFSCHCYNSCQIELSHLSSVNQKKSNFKPLAANGKLYTKMECYNPEND